MMARLTHNSTHNDMITRETFLEPLVPDAEIVGQIIWLQRASGVEFCDIFDTSFRNQL